MQDIVTAVITAVGVCLITGPILIPFLRRLKFGQNIRSDGPKGHLQKAGTPTMGGLMFFLSLTVGTIVSVGATPVTVVLLAVTLGFGIIGFLDDFIKIILKRPLGLKARHKIFGQLLISGIYAYLVAYYGGRGTDLAIPGSGWGFDPGWLYIPIAMFIMVGTTNSVNLTDGLDGLAAGVTLFVALAYLFISDSWGMGEISAFSGALLGSCLGFLFFNINPARLFMGDTGSLALGGAISSLAVMTKTELLLPVLGGVYVLEALSDIIQVSYFRFSGGKRIFRMAPLHHHYELMGWSEQKVVFVFWTAGAIFAILAVIIAI